MCNLNAAAEGPMAPELTASSPESVSVRRGEPLSLECAAQGWPVPQVSWEKYGGHLPTGRYTQVFGQ